VTEQELIRQVHELAAKKIPIPDWRDAEIERLRKEVADLRRLLDYLPVAKYG
jgi:hypothetical protein